MAVNNRNETNMPGHDGAMCEPVCESPANSMSPSTPFGATGATADRDGSGRFVPGNRAALITGERSAAFWAAHDASRRDIAGEVMSDLGHRESDAPAAVRLAADSIAQSALIQRSAFDKLVAEGGPFTTTGRTRRTFAVWLTATDRLEKHLRLVGLRRAPKSTQSFADAMRAAAAANPRRDGDEK